MKRNVIFMVLEYDSLPDFEEAVEHLLNTNHEIAACGQYLTPDGKRTLWWAHMVLRRRGEAQS